jgi:hypothetical protein
MTAMTLSQADLYNTGLSFYEKTILQGLIRHHDIKVLKQTVQAFNCTWKRKTKLTNCEAYHSLEITSFNFIYT